MNPSMLDCEILDWFALRTCPVHRSTVPAKYRARVRMLLHRDPGPNWQGRWLEHHDIVLVRITPIGRMLAAAFRNGRAATAPGQTECAS